MHKHLQKFLTISLIVSIGGCSDVSLTQNSLPQEAEIVLYGKESGGGVYEVSHAARKMKCDCGAGRWLMFESKLGHNARIEHRINQLNGTEYGEPYRYYKKKRTLE